MNRRLGLLLPLFALGCEAQPATDEAANPDAPAVPLHHFTADSSAYTLRRDGEGWATSIGFVFRNPTPDTIDVVHCNGAIVMDLQKRDGDAWQSVWHGVSNGCLSPSIRILPGDSLSGRIEVWGAEAGHPNYPTFETTTIEGEYRLIWHQPRLDFAAGAPNFGDTLTIEQRTSTTFQLARPAVHGVVRWPVADRAPYRNPLSIQESFPRTEPGVTPESRDIRISLLVLTGVIAFACAGLAGTVLRA